MHSIFSFSESSWLDFCRGRGGFRVLLEDVETLFGSLLFWRFGFCGCCCCWCISELHWVFGIAAVDVTGVGGGWGAAELLYGGGDSSAEFFGTAAFGC